MGLLLIDCCICISFAMSYGLVSMLLFLSKMQSSGGDSWFFLKKIVDFFGACFI